MFMDIRLHYAFLPHDDADAAIAFYSDALGFEVRNEVEALMRTRDPDELTFTSAEVLARVEEHGDCFAAVLELQERLPGGSPVPTGREHGNVAALLAARSHVNLFVYDGAIVPDPHGLITAGHDNQTARTIAFREGDPVRRPELLAFLRAIVADNLAGGLRAIKRRRRATSSPASGI